MKKRVYLICFIFLYSITIFGCSNKEKEISPKKISPNRNFIIAGSGSNIPITGKLVELYNKKYNEKVQIPNSIGSKGGIKALKEGAIDIGLISRPLNEEEIKEGLKQLPYARIGVILGANYDVPDNNITYQDIVEIYQGKRTKWQNGKMIIVLIREEGDSSNKVLEKVVPSFEQALKDSHNDRRWQAYYTDLEMAQAIIKTPSSLGLTDTGALIASKLKIKPLNINDVAPTIDNIKNGSYKLYKDLYFIYKEPMSDRVKKFFDLVYSKEGARVILINGGISLKGK